MSFNHEFMDAALLFNIVRDPNKLFGNQLDLWNWQTYHHEGLEGNGQVIAVQLWAAHCTFELAMHEVHDYGLRTL